MPPKKPKQSTLKPPESQHPSPFTKAPDSLAPLLTQLDPAQVYIVHIDRTPLHTKKTTLTFAFLLNLTIAILLAWRAYIAIPKYLALGQTFLGYESDATVDVKKQTNEKIWILLSRTAMMIIDYLLARLVVPWPYTFFFERPANPMTWRWKVQFEKEEVVVRVCRNWEGKDMMKGEKKGEESPFFKTRILPAIETEVLEKTGYLMMDGSWDLDFAVMQDAHTLIRQEKVTMADMDSLVLVHQDAGGFKGWLAWRFRNVVVLQESAEEKSRKSLLAFKEFLGAQGKESLFWKWQEIVEDERGEDGGFTTEAQERVERRVGEVFKKEGIDFNKAMEEVGRVEAPAAGKR